MQRKNIKTKVFFFLSLLLPATLQAQDYLKEVLERMEGIQSASYSEHTESWEPGDTLPVFTATFFVQEYRNPQDTTIGACFAKWDSKDKNRFEEGYDGHIHASVYHDDREIMLDDFTVRRLPFRPVTPPFFQYKYPSVCS